MNKKYSIAFLVFVAIFATGSLVYVNHNNTIENLTAEEIKAKYCHVTAEVRKTDVYCQNPDLHIQHVQQNKVIEN